MAVSRPSCGGFAGRAWDTCLTCLTTDSLLFCFLRGRRPRASATTKPPGHIVRAYTAVRATGGGTGKTSGTAATNSGP
jgi:hypothetical protein